MREWLSEMISLCAEGMIDKVPIGSMLFLGPTGLGKTRAVDAVAEALFGDPNAIVKIDCAEFHHSHEIAKLIGSPPGYLSHRETSPIRMKLQQMGVRCVFSMLKSGWSLVNCLPYG
jgi:ATP-dependent Clp protease ATP-binding subunit ClpA